VIPTRFRAASCVQKFDWVLCELKSDGFGSEARITKDDDLLVSRRFTQDWQTLQWAEEERRFIEKGGECQS
jgi:hypothetical protein